MERRGGPVVWGEGNGGLGGSQQAPGLDPLGCTNAHRALEIAPGVK